MAAPEFPWSKHGTRTSRKLAERNVDDVPMTFGFLNTAFAQPSEGYARFRLFPRLPLELRRRIWKFSLPTQRLLKITLTAAGSTGDPASPFENSVMDSSVHATYRNENHLGNIVSGAGYYVRLDSTKTVSPLLYVSHEASAVVRRIYRVQVPTVQCIGHTSSPFLQFCPKRDTILVAIERKEDEAYFADFVHDAQAYDPKGKGVLHLAIMDKGSSLHLPMETADIHSQAQPAMYTTFTNLRTVTLVHLLYTESRQMFSNILSGVLANKVSQSEKVRFNRAYPLWSSNASYRVLPSDPRCIYRHLELVDCSWDPRRLIDAWRRLEAASGVFPIPENKMRVLIATSDRDGDLAIASTTQARRFRQQEEESWVSHWELEGIYKAWYPEMSNPDSEEDLEFSKSQNAIGFWSIPLEAFGPVPEVPDNKQHRWEMTRLCNLSAFQSQIQLGLFDVIE